MHRALTGDDLIFRSQGLALLKLEITKRSRESQVSVHTSKLDKAAGTCDAVELG